MNAFVLTYQVIFSNNPEKIVFLIEHRSTADIFFYKQTSKGINRRVLCNCYYIFIHNVSGF